MSLLKNIQVGNDIGGEESDNLGGRSLLESNIYKLKVKLAYLMKSGGGATGLTVLFNGEDGSEYRETVYITNKKGEVFYVNGKNEKNYLPGFNMANSLAMLTTGKGITELDTETKTINVWNKDSKAELPTPVEMVMDLLEQEVYVGILKQKEDKQTLVGDKYVPTGETREVNVMDKLFCAKEKFDKLTSVEIRAKAETPVFYNDWLKKWEGQTRDKSTGAAGQAGAPGKAGGVTAPASKPAASLFGED